MINNEESEQNVIRAVLMCLIVYLLYISFLAPPPTIPPEESTVAAAESEASPTETSADTSTTAIAEGEVPEPRALDENGEPVPHAEAPEPAFVEVNPWDADFYSETIQSELNSEGGALNSLQYVDYKASMKTQPIWSFLLGKMRGSEDPWLPYGEDPGPEQILTEDGIFLASGAQWDFEIERYELVEQSDSSATVRRTREDGLQITKTYAWGEAKEILEIDVEFKNVGDSKWSGPVWVGAVDVFTGSAGRYSSVARPAIVADETLTSLDDIEDVESSTESVDGSVSWFGIQDTYFMAAAIPQTPNWGRGLFASVENGDPEKSRQVSGSPVAHIPCP